MKAFKPFYFLLQLESIYKPYKTKSSPATQDKTTCPRFSTKFTMLHVSIFNQHYFTISLMTCMNSTKSSMHFSEFFIIYPCLSSYYKNRPVPRHATIDPNALISLVIPSLFLLTIDLILSNGLNY